MNTTNTTGRLPGARQVSGPKAQPAGAPKKTAEPPKKTAPPTLLDLARQLDLALDPEARIAIGELMKPLLGARLQEFDQRLEKLHEATPTFPWPAESVVLRMEPIPEPRVSDDGRHAMMKCGCSVQMETPWNRALCDFHQEVLNFTPAATAPRQEPTTP